jgi:hypothetical protein
MWASPPLIRVATCVCNSLASYSLTVTVVHAKPPQITCSSDIAVPNDVGECGVVVSFNAPSATDNCASGGIAMAQTVGLANGSLFPVGPPP